MSETRAAYKKFHFLYKTTCIATGRYYYGMHSTDDLNDGYLGSGYRLRRSIKKHGRENHVREIVGDMFPDRESLRAGEAELIIEKVLKDPLCMNIHPGGRGWIEPTQNMTQKRSPETRRLLSERAREREARKRAEGHVVSDETRARMSASRGGERNHFFGKNHSEEVRAKMSRAARGRPSNMKGKHHTDETKRKISERLRALNAHGVNPHFDVSLTYEMIENAYVPGMSGKELSSRLGTTFMKVVKRLQHAGFKNFRSWTLEKAATSSGSTRSA